MREGLQGVWREGRRGLVSWMEGGGRGEREGRGEGSRAVSEETLGDAEWEAKFLEVGEMVEMCLRMRGSEGEGEVGEREGEMALRKTLGGRATEDMAMRFRERIGGPAEKKMMGRMEARDERGEGWGARYEEIKAMVELEKEVERGIWR